MYKFICFIKMLLFNLLIKKLLNVITVPRLFIDNLNQPIFISEENNNRLVNIHFA